MAKKKRATAAQDAQQGLNRIMKVMERLLKEPPPNLDGMANRIAVGADHLMDALDKKGIRCMCKYQGKYPRSKVSCSCRTKRKGERSLAGLHCRDAQGTFVPVGQCTGPVGRDPKTGRFISLLRAEMR